MRVDPTNPFWDRVALLGAGPDDCWLWTGSLRNGYGGWWLMTNGKAVSVDAHRYAFFLTHGRYPDHFASHTCHTRACCNPAHILDETHRQNTDRSIEAGHYAANGQWGKGAPRDGHGRFSTAPPASRA